MILEKQTEANVQQTGEIQDSIGMSLDLDSAQILMQMLSKNLYSDAIGSTIRETASNALDAHRRAGTDKPIVVSFGVNSSNNYEFSVEDFGIGLDADDVKNIISKYGKSTKRNSATELGMMGLGFKAPLAYSSSFYFVCRKNGMERKYMMYEGEDTNTIDLLYEKPTTECNGVKVIVPVEYYDRYDFVTKISEQLAYFENVYFDVKDFDNNFSIIRSEHFQWSPIAKDGKLHVCLDNVYYPLEFDKLGIDQIIFPVALRFSLSDGIFPTPNRESIRYTKEAKQIILKKIEMVANYFVEKYNESVEETDDFFQVYDYFRSENRYLKSFKTLDIALVQRFSTIKMEKPKLKGVETLNLEHLCKNHSEFILNEYRKRYKVDNGKFRELKTNWSQAFSIGDARNYQLDNGSTVILFSDKISGNMKDYIKETYPSKHWRTPTSLLKRAQPYKLGGPNKSSGTRYSEYNTYYDILVLKNIPKDKWRKAIQEFQSIVQYVTSSFIKMEDIVIPQDWLDKRKKIKVTVSKTVGNGTRRVKLKGEVSVKTLEKLERYVDGKNSKQVPSILNLATAHQQKHLSVYGKAEDYKLMDELFTAFRKKNEVKFMIVSDRELKSLENVELHNLMPINKFMEGKNKVFKRVITAYLIKQLMGKYEYAFSKMNHLTSVSSELQSKMHKLYEYHSKNWHHGSDKIYEAMLEVANEHTLFDMEIYDTYLEIKDTLEKLPFINSILQHMSSYSKCEGLRQVLIDQFKYYRKRLNYTNYKLTEETLTSPIENEEEIEELYID